MCHSLLGGCGADAAGGQADGCHDALKQPFHGGGSSEEQDGAEQTDGKERQSTGQQRHTPSILAGAGDLCLRFCFETIYASCFCPKMYECMQISWTAPGLFLTNNTVSSPRASTTQRKGTMICS